MKLKIRLEKREHASPLLRLLVPVISIILAFLFIGVILKCMGYSPVKAYTYVFRGAFGSGYNISESVLQSIPLMLASLGVAVALSMSAMNIGAEGQYAIGAWAATGVACFCGFIPDGLVLPCMIAAGFLAGAVWGMIAILPTAKWGVSETITTLMFNYIALQWNDFFVYGSWRDASSLNLPTSPVVPEYAQFTTLFGTRIHTGLFLAIGAAVVLFIFLRKSTLGYQIRVIGQNRKAAKYAGMNIEKTMLFVMLLSGGLAGLAGVAQIGGAGKKLITDVAGGAGYTALVIARICKNDPLLIVVVSLLFGGLAQGSYSLQMAGVPYQMAKMLQGAILLCALGGELFTTHTLSVSWVKTSPEEEAVKQ